ncbi:MAG: calcium-binding protein [Hyphomicrobiales bacterium]
MSDPCHVWLGLGDDDGTNSVIDGGLDTSGNPGHFDFTSSAWHWNVNDRSGPDKDFDNDRDSITNAGVISGGVVTGHGADKVTNTGTIYGTLDTATFNWISDVAAYASAAVDLSIYQADDNDTVVNKGTITGMPGQGLIWTGLGSDTVDNAGYVEGISTGLHGDTIYTPYGPVDILPPSNAALFDADTVINSGTVHFDIWTGAGDDKIYNRATGKVLTGNINGDEGNDYIENAGFVKLMVSGGEGSDIIRNTGTIGSEVQLGYDADNNQLLNDKLIGGDVTGGSFSGGDNTIENKGNILGNIWLLSGHDIVRNLGSGRIDGSIRLGAGTDEFYGNASQEKVIDEGGGDTYMMGAGDDRVTYGTGSIDGASNSFDGGLGVDTLDFSGLTVANYTTSTINLAAPLTQSASFSGPHAQSDVLRGFENILAGGGDDTITGSDSANVISGGDGADRITGGKGQDTLTGGGGADTFVFSSMADSTPGAADVITDFEHGVDKIALQFITAQVFFPYADHFGAVVTGHGMWRITHVGNNTVLEVTADADAAPDLIIHFNGNITLTADDFVF